MPSMRFAFQVELCQNGDTLLDSSITNASEEKAKIRSNTNRKKLVKLIDNIDLNRGYKNCMKKEATAFIAQLFCAHEDFS